MSEDHDHRYFFFFSTGCTIKAILPFIGILPRDNWLVMEMSNGYSG